MPVPPTDRPSAPPTPKIAGVSSPPPKEMTPASASSGSVKPIPVPVSDVKSGDELIDETDAVSQQAVPVRHILKLYHRHDASQFYKYWMRCSCGCESRMHTEELIRKAADDHLQRAFVVENKWR